MKSALALPIISILYIVFFTLLLFHANHHINESKGKVRKGSSLGNPYSGKKDHTYWLSPSGNFAFGFYPLCTACDDPSYVVGIWLAKTENKTLVWSANRNHRPLNNLSSIFFDGNLILEIRTRKHNNQIVVQQKHLLPEAFVSAEYGKLHDNGNFAFYNHDSEIIWQSFDHPTNTILGGQQLSTGQTLVSDSIWWNGDWQHNGRYISYSLGIGFIHNNRYGRICICGEHEGLCIYSSSEFLWDSTVTLNLDATSGRLYLVDWKNVVLQNITQGDDNKFEHDTIIYRGIIASDGIFRLYKERMIGSQDGKSILVWDTQENDNKAQIIMWITILIAVMGILMGILLTYIFPQGKV